MIGIYPSLMAANQLNLENEITLLQPYCDGFHLDVMDNHFVPNLALGTDAVNAIAQISKKVWIHLMLENPQSFFEKLKLPDDSLVSFHFESNVDVELCIKIIKEKKYVPGIAIHPKTALSDVFPFLSIVDHVLIMSVNPGFSYQSFLESASGRLFQLHNYRKSNNLSFKIGVDGGINSQTIEKVVKHGADDIAIGGAIFNQKDKVGSLQKLRELVHSI